MVDPIMVTSLVEWAKMGLVIYFHAAREAGLDEEQIREFFRVEKEKFDMNTPDKLKDVLRRLK